MRSERQALVDIASEIDRHERDTRLTERGELHMRRLRSILLDVQPKPAPDVTERLGNAAYEAYVAAGEDTDGARNWRELFLPMKFPEWSDVVGSAVRRVVMERDAAEDQVEAVPAGIERVQRNGDFQTVYFTDGSQVYDSSTQDETGRWRDGRGIDAVLRLARLAGVAAPPDVDVYADSKPAPAGGTIDRDATLAAIIACAPRNMELRPDGSEDHLAAAYVEGVHVAHDAVSRLALVRPVEGVVLTRLEASITADWYDYIVDQGGNVPEPEAELAFRLRSEAAS